MIELTDFIFEDVSIILIGFVLYFLRETIDIVFLLLVLQSIELSLFKWVVRIFTDYCLEKITYKFLLVLTTAQLLLNRASSNLSRFYIPNTKVMIIFNSRTQELD
jgi:hypothetical protein